MDEENLSVTSICNSWELAWAEFKGWLVWICKCLDLRSGTCQFSPGVKLQNLSWSSYKAILKSFSVTIANKTFHVLGSILFMVIHKWLYMWQQPLLLNTPKLERPYINLCQEKLYCNLEPIKAMSILNENQVSSEIWQ